MTTEIGGRRGWKDVSGVKTYYLYDWGEPVVELDASGSVTAVNAYAPDGLVARTVGSTTTQYAFDPQGKVAQRLDASGSVLNSSVYDAYGGESSATTPNDPFGYDGRWGYYADRETGLLYCQNRYYDPANGRWLNRDPIGATGGINVYGYCGGKPVTAADPSGLIDLGSIISGQLNYLGPKGPLAPSNPAHLPYGTPEEAAAAGIADAMPQSSQDNSEAAGVVLPAGTGYRPTPPAYTAPGALETAIPYQFSMVAMWHTHPDKNDPPSNEDYNGTTDAQYPGYVGDSSGSMWEMKPGDSFGPRYPKKQWHKPYRGPNVRPIPGGWKPWKPGGGK